MITDINSEDRLVQTTFADYLRNKLGWDSVYAWNKEIFLASWCARKARWRWF